MSEPVVIDWRPDIALTLRERCRQAELLRNELSAASRAGRVSSPELDRLLDGALAGDGRLHPDCFDLNNVLAARVAHREPPPDEVLLDALRHCAEEVEASRARAAENLQRLGGRFDISPRSPRALSVLRRAVCTRVPERVEEARLVELREPALRQLREAYRILMGAWPELFAELQEVVNCLLFFAFPGMLGFSGIEYHGGIFLRVEDLADPVKLAENVLHEGSHVRLNTAMAGVTYFEPDDGRYPSPLRSDPRPIYGVFHQMFVLGRMLHFYDRAQTRLGVQHARHAVVRQQFDEAHAAVRSHARLTPAGRSLTDSLREVVGGTMP